MENTSFIMYQLTYKWIMENQEAYQKSRSYKRTESYYNANSKSNFYSTIMLDIIMLILSLLAIIYLVLFFDSGQITPNLFSMLVFMFAGTILISFASHIVAIKASWMEMHWAEEEMGERNGLGENKSNGSGYWNKMITIFNYCSWFMFILSFITFFLVIL